jgi:hypothetical protein
MRRLLAIAALALVLAPALASADGDPASDVLLGQNVFLPYSPISQTIQRRLYALCDAARQAGYPVRIALIVARTDLGVVPALFGKPNAYARFLSSELTGVVSGPVLVVMPDGFGLAREGHSLPMRALAGIPVTAGADGLGTAAIAGVQRLAAASGHALAASAALTSGGSGASEATVRHALIAMAALVAMAALAIALAFAARARRCPPPGG